MLDVVQSDIVSQLFGDVWGDLRRIEANIVVVPPDTATATFNITKQTSYCFILYNVENFLLEF